MGYFFGVLTSAMFILAIFGHSTGIGMEAEALIKECQKELPRNEHCEIIAVPNKENVE